MPHVWILDVLTDLTTYAERNDLPAIAHAAREALDVAKSELSSLPSPDLGQGAAQD